MYDNGSQLAVTGAGVSVLGMTVGLGWFTLIAAILVVSGLLGLTALRYRHGQS
ncbi:hypothetical protein [Streptomyces sp. AK02-04a]|uniref:hypothetical protein n=1 Tax=Streptomyces sp. AK02-04a TaxID=3028649 RepID=UPI0029ABE933|nr:hypothetical protein [Streptomyces sp. AK02-04a]MDX3764004.1 hypothetical protein [Streptomyces sp. AK02-04a]